MLFGKVPKLSITFIISDFPDSAPVSLDRVMPDGHRTKSEPELMFCCGGLI
jgi:hypothetical protein